MIIFGKNFLDLAYWPIYGSVLLLLWTVITSPWSNYGDLWAIIPAILIFPMVFCLHIFLLVKNDWQIKFVFYGIAHLAILFVISVACLMIISKDSL